MSRPPPPMYSRVQRKRPPAVHVVQVAPLPPVPPPAPATAPTDAGKKTSSRSRKEPEKLAKDKPAKKAAASKAKPEEAPKAKKIKWSEDMTQRDLYRIAKKAGLAVTSRDPKSWIVKKLAEATR